MITARGYSKDKSIMPEGIMLTMPVIFFEETGWELGPFTETFERYMKGEDAIWNFRLKNLPVHDVAYVYLVWDKKVQFRTNLVMYERNVAKSFANDSRNGKERHFPASNWVLLSGPAIRPPHEMPQRGFQGFRYTTKLF